VGGKLPNSDFLSQKDVSNFAPTAVRHTITMRVDEYNSFLVSTVKSLSPVSGSGQAVEKLIKTKD
jgi:hypothetical protein